MLFISEIVRISKNIFFQVWATLNLESHIISVPIFGELKYVGQPLVSGTITMGECTLVSVDLKRTMIIHLYLLLRELCEGFWPGYYLFCNIFGCVLGLIVIGLEDRSS